MPDSSWDLRLEAIKAELGIMLAHLAWHLGPKWKIPVEIEGQGGLRGSPTGQQPSEPRLWGGEGEGINPLPKDWEKWDLSYLVSPGSTRSEAKGLGGFYKGIQS